MNSMETGVIHIDPTQREYRAYADHLFAYNGAIQRKVGSDLYRLLGGLGRGAVVATTGSDARLEKGPSSLIEIILFKEDSGDVDEFVSKIKNYISANSALGLFKQDIETRNLGEGHMCEHVLYPSTEQQKTIYSPNRMFDARMLFGNKSMFKKVKKLLATELSSSYGASVFDKIKGRAKEHAKVVSSGKQKYVGGELVHYNLDEGVAYYDPDKKLWSFKQGPLRAVQYALVRDGIKLIRAGVDYKEVLAIPQNTISKMNYLEVHGRTGLSRQQVQDICDNYKFFLWLYHLSQREYAVNNGKQVVFGSKEVRERCNDIVSICSLDLIKGYRAFR